MAEATLTALGITEGVWHGVLETDGGDDHAPDLVATHQGEEIAGLSVTAEPFVRVVLGEKWLGVQTFVLAERDGGRVLGSFALVAGEPLAEDLRAEIALLRAELDMLKRAFRRHCLESAQR